MGRWIKGFAHQDEQGQGIVEYGLIIGLIAVIVVAIFIALGPQIKKLFEGTTPGKSAEGTKTIESIAPTGTTTSGAEKK